MFFKKRIIKKFKEKLIKIKHFNNLKLSEQKTEFSKILNHDIKTALLAQSNCLELFLKGRFGKIPPLQKEILAQILSSNKFLTEIINNAIFLNDIDEKTANLNYEKVDMVNQTEFCLESIRQSAKDKEQNIVFNPPEYKINLNCDKKLIRKIIENLLAGSVSYGYEKSDIIVSIEENAGKIQFKAKNKSVYMSKEKLNAIFESDKTNCDFNQLGMKLNLNVAKKLIKAHNWDFIATSDREENTSTFGFAVKK